MKSISMSYPAVVVGAGSLIVGLLLAGCALEGSIIEARREADWSPILSPAQISVVRTTFPSFTPDLFAPGTTPAGSLNPGNFAPAQFLGPPNPQGFRATPAGILIETNGYDGPGTPAVLPPSGTYFNTQGEAFEFQLGTITRSPQNILEGYMGVPTTAGAPTVQIDLRLARVDFNAVDEFMLAVQSQLANALPSIRTVDPTSCEIVIEPSIVFVSSADGGNYAGGVTEPLGDGKYRCHVAALKLDSPQDMANWTDYLVDEGLNCFVSAAGRPDLAR
jgi:hypothetical protein